MNLLDNITNPFEDKEVIRKILDILILLMTLNRLKIIM